MLCVFRTGACKVGGQLTGLHKVASTINSIIKQQIAFISCRELRKDRPPRPPPFPYKDKTYNLFYKLFDNTLKRFDDNSKVVIIEGPIAAGKDKFARKFAEEFEMKYFPPVSFDFYYKSPYGFDLRDFDEKFKDYPNLQSVDVNKFLANPNHVNTAVFQHHYYRLKINQYADALIHLLSTGEGVVIQRSPWSDIVFMRAMINAGYVSLNAYDMYKDMILRTLHMFLKPHVVIYLDVNPKSVKEKIMKRGNPNEVKSKVLTEKYLTDIDNNYKEKFLKEMDMYSHVLCYDWTDGGDFEYIIEDVERLKFNYQHRDKKMEDWTVEDPEYWRERRLYYSPHRRSMMLQDLVIPRVDVPEMTCTGEDDEFYTIFNSETPGLRYALGYDPDLDKNILWKTKDYTEDDILHERGLQTTVNTSSVNK